MDTDSVATFKYNMLLAVAEEPSPDRPKVVFVHPDLIVEQRALRDVTRRFLDREMPLTLVRDTTTVRTASIARGGTTAPAWAGHRSSCLRSLAGAPRPAGPPAMQSSWPRSSGGLLPRVPSCP